MLGWFLEKIKIHSNLKYYISSTKIKLKMLLLYTYLYIYSKTEPKKCIYKNVRFRISDFFMFISIAFSLFSYVSLFRKCFIMILIPFTWKIHGTTKSFSSFLPPLSSENIWSLLFLINLQNKKDSSIGTWPTKRQQHGLQIFLPPLVCHDCTLVFLL